MSKLGEYFHKKYYPDLDINLVEKHLSNPKVFDTAVSFVHKNHYQDLPIENVRSAFVGEHHDPVLESIYKKYPAFKNMGAVTLKADTNFTRDKTGYGDIEFMDTKNLENNTVYYPNGYTVENPNKNGFGIVYNPNTNNEQNIMLDMLHGLKSADPVYSKHRKEFETSFIKANSRDLKNDWDNKVKEEGVGDGFEQFKENWVDGQIRGLMFDGTPEQFQKQNYWVDAKKTYLQNKDVATKFQQIQDYLKTGVAYTLPETVIRGNKSGQAPPMSVE
jgi:hypothetical protein